MFFPAVVCNVLRSAIWLATIGSVLPPSQVFGCDCGNCSVEFVDSCSWTCCGSHEMADQATYCQLATECRATECRDGAPAWLDQASNTCSITCNCSECECSRGKPAPQTTPTTSSRFPGRDDQTDKATVDQPNLPSPANLPLAAYLSETTGSPLPSSAPLRVLYCVWLN
jgi:hypothetical protein